MNTEHATPTVPDILLERYRLNELPRKDAEQLADRIRQDEGLRQRLEALDRSDREARAIHAPEWLAARVAHRLNGRSRSARRPFVYGAVCATLAAAAVLAVVLTPRTAQGPDQRAGGTTPSAQDNDRVKGLPPMLAVYRRTAQGSEALADGAVARPGDLLRVGYRAAGRTYGAIVSIDGRGTVTRHLPAAGDRAATLKREATVLLDTAYELDDAPQWERFYFVTGDAPFAIAPIVESARRGVANSRRSPPDALTLPHGLEQTTFSIQKEARP